MYTTDSCLISTYNEVVSDRTAEQGIFRYKHIERHVEKVYTG